MSDECQENHVQLEEGSQDPWYKKGLRFHCTECGGCCTGAPGYVWITGEDITNLSTYLKISRAEFLKNYTREIFTRRSLREDSKNYDCVFLKDKRCSVYPARPKQCRTFPWWKEHLSSESSWLEAKKHCEGIDHEEAPLISVQEIEKHL